LAVNPASPEVLWLGFRAEHKLGDKTAAAAYGRRIETDFGDSQQAQMLRAGLDQ
jgi:Tfp pilus assembly protein PilF